MTLMSDAIDPFDLQRFIDAQEHVYAQAISEIRAGEKVSHWMWFIFPQLDGLGYSSMAKRYAIRNEEEARAYLEHPVLGPRLRECAQAAIDVPSRTAFEIFDSPDDVKLKSSATLFAAVSPAGSVFAKLLERFFDGERDERTVNLLGRR